MVELKDAKKFAITSVVLGSLVMVLGVLLALQEAEVFDVGIFASLLETFSFVIWASILLVVLLLLVILILVVLGATNVPLERERPVRRVQCGSCEAVFQFDEPERFPIQVPCPNCDQIGVYDGRSASPFRTLRCPVCRLQQRAIKGTRHSCIGCGHEGNIPF